MGSPPLRPPELQVPQQQQGHVLPECPKFRKTGGSGVEGEGRYGRRVLGTNVAHIPAFECSLEVPLATRALSPSSRTCDHGRARQTAPQFPERPLCWRPRRIQSLQHKPGSAPALVRRPEAGLQARSHRGLAGLACCRTQTWSAIHRNWLHRSSKPVPESTRRQSAQTRSSAIGPAATQVASSRRLGAWRLPRELRRPVNSRPWFPGR
jgi:hypothetical protein